MIGHKNNLGNNSTITIPTISGDGLIYTVPAGQELEQIIVIETGGADVTTNFGTSALGTEITTMFNIASRSNIEDVIYYNNGAAFSVYVSSPAWTTSVITVKLILKYV